MIMKEGINMTSFKNVLISNITKRQKNTREEYEEVIANWILHGWLTDDEAIEVFAVLDEYYPVETPVV